MDSDYVWSQQVEIYSGQNIHPVGKPTASGEWPTLNAEIPEDILISAKEAS